MILRVVLFVILTLGVSFAGSGFDGLNYEELLKNQAPTGPSEELTELSKERMQEFAEYARASALAYRKNRDILKKYPTAKIFTTEKSKVKFFLVKWPKKKKQMLAIRGTDNFKNWLVK